jgi:hypothetical protein
MPVWIGGMESSAATFCVLGDRLKGSGYGGERGENALLRMKSPRVLVGIGRPARLAREYGFPNGFGETAHAREFGRIGIGSDERSIVVRSTRTPPFSGALQSANS